MNEQIRASTEDVRETLKVMIFCASEDTDGKFFDESSIKLEDVRTFEEEMLLTNDDGISITFSNGQKFYLTIKEA